MIQKIYSVINIYCQEKDICFSEKMSEIVYDDIDFIYLIAIIEEELGSEFDNVSDLCSTSFDTVEEFCNFIENNVTLTN